MNKLNMTYEGALEAAGAEVLAFGEFGSYQGDWIAKVRYNGETGWVHGYYGSCSGCDSLQAEFDYDTGDDRVWENGEYRAKTEDEMKSERARFAEFGAGYLGDIVDYDAILAHAERNADWDMDAEEMIKFVKEHEATR